MALTYWYFVVIVGNKCNGVGTLAEQAPEHLGTFRVRPIPAAVRESKVGKLFQDHGEQQWVFDQLRMLSHWPPHLFDREVVGRDLDIERITHGSVSFYEYRLDDARLRRRNLRVFFWVHDDSRTIWVIHGMWKKTQKIGDEVKCRVARRVRELQGLLQEMNHVNRDNA